MIRRAVVLLASLLALASLASAVDFKGGGSGSGSGTVSSGTTNQIPKYTGATTVGDSSCADDGTTVTCTAASGVSAPKFTSTGAASNSTFNGTTNYCADAGSSDAYACTIDPALTAYTTGTCYSYKANTANTGAATINFNALGAKTIKKAEGGVTTDLADNDIRAGQIVGVCYDGTNMQMQSTLGNASGAPTGAAYVTTSSDGTLTNEKIVGTDLLKVDVFTASGTWTKPANATSVYVLVIGPGGGGGSGRRGAAGSARVGGGGGGGGGLSWGMFPASILGATETVTVGAIGTGGAAVTVNDTNGNAGTNGAASTFGATAWVHAGGGISGGGGGAGTGGAGGAGGTGTEAGGSGGAASATGGVGVNGAGVTTKGATGGGSGGGLTSGDAESNGGAGGTHNLGSNPRQQSGGAAGVTGTGGGAGGAGTSVTTNVPLGGVGGGGGASEADGTNAAGAGGLGGSYGAGGGGSGASANGANSGAGANGAPGLIIVISY